MRCMKDVRAIDVSLEDTLQQIGLARLQLDSSKERFAAECLLVLKLKERERRLLQTVEMLRQLRVLRDINSAMKQHMHNGDLSLAAQCGYYVIGELASRSFRKFESTRSIVDSVRMLLLTARSRCDEKLGRICSQPFSARDYSDVLRTYLLLVTPLRSPPANSTCVRKAMCRMIWPKWMKG
jgi:hypothetical protein